MKIRLSHILAAVALGGLALTSCLSRPPVTTHVYLPPEKAAPAPKPASKPAPKPVPKPAPKPTSAADFKVVNDYD